MLDVQSALVAFLQNQAAVAAQIGAGQDARLYPEQAPPDAAYPRCEYTLVSQVPGMQLDGAAGWETARVQLDCWGDASRQGHLQANALLGALWDACSGYRGPMGAALFIQKSTCENAHKASPPPAEGRPRGDAHASLDVLLWATVI